MTTKTNIVTGEEYVTYIPKTGRKIIYSNVDEVTIDNVIEVFANAMNTHLLNKADIQFLWDYYKGKQPILNKVKVVRPEINNKIVENRANEIVAFKVGYLCGEPIQYISRRSDEQVAKEIELLNELMFSENKANKDKEIVEWDMVCGTAYRLCLADDRPIVEAPFNIYTLDPRYTFVVYSSDVDHRPLMSCSYVEVDSVIYKATCYTDNKVFHLNFHKENENERYVVEEPHYLGMNPIIEYPANNARLGAFEIVLPLLDAINAVESNRLDGIEQFVQSFLKFKNCDVDDNDVAMLSSLGAIKIKSLDGLDADVDLISQELNQSQTQTYVDSLYDAVLTICGIPNRNGNASTSDTGAAVMLRDGWSLAEARAKDSEQMFKASERTFLKLALYICSKDVNTDINLKLRDIDMQFTRRNYENIQSKAQVLIQMLQNDKIHPLLAFTHCGMFSDPEAAYQMSKKYYDESMAQYEKELDSLDLTTPDNEGI